jgi:prepilin-type N-terminal cleavage/methylation domain-containing protein
MTDKVVLIERAGSVMRKENAFTLVEILIVVVLLAILALVVIPMVSGSVISAKESALAHDLQMLRRYVLVYKSQHLEVAPGYPDGDTTQVPTEQTFIDQFTLSSNPDGQTAPIGTLGFERGPYLMKIPVNPLNHKSTVEVLADGAAFPASPDGSHGWIYKPETSEVRSDFGGTDDSGKAYYDY